MDSRFIIGIDLGTTQCALSYADLEDASLRIKTLEIPQYVADGMIEPLPTLPSVIHLCEKERKLSESEFIAQKDIAVGAYAKELGFQNSERFVHSSKSWLCHPRAERRAPILPWQSSFAEQKLSPVDAASEYLRHLAYVWNTTIGADDEKSDFFRQKIIVTVPASFDPAARNLTLEAIEQAGIKSVSLLEEPQAAFYDYLQRNPEIMVSELKGVETVLVIDIGGGTTDFSLIKADWSGSSDYPEFKRLAVGPHLLIGGDNLDLALARYVEAAFKHKGVKPVGRQWLSLLAQSHMAKEKALSGEEEENIAFTLTGAGSKVLGGSSKVKVRTEAIKQLLIDGFFPLTEADEMPDADAGLGLSEAGLPFTRDPAVTKHLAAFLKANDTIPDAVLFNGGTMKASCLKERLSDILSIWGGKEIKILENPHPILAVAAGAAYYGLVSVGYGRRIQSGSPVSVYLGIGTSKASSKSCHVPEQLLCILSKGSEPEKDYEFENKTFGIDLSVDSAFYLFYTPSPPKAEQMGRLIKFNSKRYLPLPPLMLKAKTAKGEKQVAIKVKLRETGFMQMMCEEIDGGFSHELRFDLGESEKSLKKSQQDKSKKSVPLTAVQIKSIDALLTDAFDNKVEYNHVFKGLEEIVGFGRNQWDAPLLRQLFDMFAEREADFNKDYSALNLYFRLTGFCLRPGFGVLGDAARVDKIWALTDNTYKCENAEFWADWWVMLKRISCGFSVERQDFLKSKLENILFDAKKQGKKTREVSRHERNQIWRLLGNLERISAQEKERLGNRIINTPMSYGVDAISLAVLSRLGGRILTYAPDSAMVSKEVADSWAAALLKKAIPGNSYLDTALRELGRKTGDRLVQIDDLIRKDIIDIFKKKQRKNAFLKPLIKAAKLEDNDLAEITGEALPSGVVWVKEG
ncbi:MAG: Hsp70 family protein [Candidatus Riflebacteria bacterium]|nr:Hsp70 family protein [Candidatus Riflebacteria bacterium]